MQDAMSFSGVPYCGWLWLSVSLCVFDLGPKRFLVTVCGSTNEYKRCKQTRHMLYLQVVTNLDMNRLIRKSNMMVLSKLGYSHVWNENCCSDLDLWFLFRKVSQQVLTLKPCCRFRGRCCFAVFLRHIYFFRFHICAIFWWFPQHRNHWLCLTTEGISLLCMPWWYAVRKFMRFASLQRLRTSVHPVAVSFQGLLSLVL